MTLLTEVPHFSSSAFSFLGIVYKIRRRKSEGAGKFPVSLRAHNETHICAHTGPCTTIPLCRLWEQQLHIWKFLESLGSHSNVAAAGLQLSGRGHGHPLHRAQPDEGQALHLTHMPNLSWRFCDSLFVSPTCARLPFSGWPSPWWGWGSAPGPAACSEEWWIGTVGTEDLRYGKHWRKRSVHNSIGPKNAFTCTMMQ